MMTFHEAVVAYRHRAGMSQRALAERAGLTASHLNRIEKGTRKPPALRSVLRISSTLHLTAHEAKELIELAGYSSATLHARLTFPSPTVRQPDYDEEAVDLTTLHAALAKLPPDKRQSSVDAIVALLNALFDSLMDRTTHAGTEQHDAAE